MRKAHGVDAYWMYVRPRGTPRIRFRYKLSYFAVSAKRSCIP